MPPLSSITFLAPLPAIVAAAITLPLLLFLYFLKLRRRPARVSSTLLWQSASRDLQVNAPFRIIRPSWILLLQLLALLAFLTALARPAIESDSATDASAARVVILIDTSASMAAPAEPASDQSRLDRAKEQAARLARALPASAQCMLISCAHEPITHLAFSRNRAELLRSLDNIQQTDQPANLPAAIELLRAFAAPTSEDEPAAPPRVILFSDGNPTASARTTDTDPDIASALAALNLQFVRVGPEPEAERDNLAITALSARRDDADPTKLRVYARLQSTLGAPIQPALICRLNDQLVPVPDITIPAQASAPLAFTVDAPSTALLTLSIPRADHLPSDSTASIFIQPPRALRILYVKPNARALPPAFDPTDALAAFEPETLESITLAEYERRIENPASLARYSLVVFDAVRPSALPPVPTISFASPVPLPAVGLTRYEPTDPQAQPTRFVFWKRTHPLLRYVTLDTAVISDHMRLTLPSESAPPGAPTATVIATATTGPLIALLNDAAIPRVIAAFPLATEVWLREPAFHIFLANAIEYLTLAAAPSTQARKTTDTITIRPTPNAASISLDGPLSISRTLNESTPTITLPPLPIAGTYQVTNAIEPTAVAVNLLDPDESAIGTSETLSIANTQTAAGSLARAALREIWQYFVALAFILLTIEWLVVARRMKL